MKQFNLSNLSSLYDVMIEGYENDEDSVRKLMDYVRKDFGLNNLKLKKLLSCSLHLDDINIVKIWNAIYKWSITNIDVIKSYIVQYVYIAKKYKLKIGKEGVDTEYLLKDTCINSADRCKTCIRAAKRGHIECLKYIHEYGLDLDPFSSALPVLFTAINGHLECLKYLHKCGLGMTICACMHAIIGGKFDCLRYIIDNGCPLYDAATKHASEFGRLDSLKYLVEKGYPTDIDICLRLTTSASTRKDVNEKGKEYCKEYLLELKSKAL
jgi:hypothetical protein